jgi:hypothetical protein
MQDYKEFRAVAKRISPPRLMGENDTIAPERANLCFDITAVQIIRIAR